MFVPELGKVNFNGLIMQLASLFSRKSSVLLFFLSQINVQEIYLKMDIWLMDLYLIKQKSRKKGLKSCLLNVYFTEELRHRFLFRSSSLAVQ